jgi:hypothetical protein
MGANLWLLPTPVGPVRKWLAQLSRPILGIPARWSSRRPGAGLFLLGRTVPPAPLAVGETTASPIRPASG